MLEHQMFAYEGFVKNNESIKYYGAMSNKEHFYRNGANGAVNKLVGIVLLHKKPHPKFIGFVFKQNGVTATVTSECYVNEVKTFLIRKLHRWSINRQFRGFNKVGPRHRLPEQQWLQLLSPNYLISFNTSKNQ